MVIDAHAHLAERWGNDTWEERDRLLIDAADRLGIDQLACSLLSPRPGQLDQFIQGNRWAKDSADRYPGRILPYAYVNAGFGQAALDEVRYCVEELGFIGVKVYNEYYFNDPVMWPLVELCIELGVPILEHAGRSHYYNPTQPRISDGGVIAETANRYPEAMIICGHIGGGGDWEWTIKALRDAPTAYLDTSGSVVDEGMIEMAVDILGADRLLFACDMSMTAGIGKMRGAQISDEARRKIMGENMQGILARRGQ